MAIKVFISYAYQDKELAENVKHELATGGHLPVDTVFFDAQDIAVGEDIRQRLRLEIGAADAVVLVMSKNAEASQWINYEAGLADALGKKILVVGTKEAGETPLLANLADYQQIEIETLS